MKVSYAVLAAALVSTAGASALSQIALAQPVAVYDPAQLPATRGQVQQYSLTPRGDVDGVILKDGTQVLLPPRLGTQLVAIIKPGDSVTVHGLKAQSLPLIKAMSVTADGSGKTVVDSGPPGDRLHRPDRDRQAQTVEGRIKEALYGPRGDLNGVLLEDGTQVHLPPPRAAAMSKDLQPGNTLVVEGFGVSNALGRSIDARKIGPSTDKLVEVGSPRPAFERMGFGHWHRHGPVAPLTADSASPAKP